MSPKLALCLPGRCYSDLSHLCKKLFSRLWLFLDKVQ